MTPSARCSVAGCGRLTRARGLCASHFQQMRRGRPLVPLFSARMNARVALPGLRVSKVCAAALKRRARDTGTTPYDLACDVLERWAKRQKEK